MNGGREDPSTLGRYREDPELTGSRRTGLTPTLLGTSWALRATGFPSQGQVRPRPAPTGAHLEPAPPPPPRPARPHLSVLEAKQEHLLHQGQSRFLGVALVVVVLLVAAALRLVLAAAAAASRRPLLVGSVPGGLGAPLHQARAPLGQRGHGSGRSAAPDRQGRGTGRLSLTAPAPGASVLILGAGAMSVGCGAEGGHEEPGLGKAGEPGVGGVHKGAFRPRPWPDTAQDPRAEAAAAAAVAAALPNMAARADVTGGCGSAGAGRGRSAGSGASEGRGWPPPTQADCGASSPPGVSRAWDLRS